jgi:hypothetical protein
MIIYCAGPIKGDTTYQKFYAEFIEFVEEEGHTALAELSGKYSVPIPLTDEQLYKRDIKWIDGSALMIAEVSGPSLGVGFELAYALLNRKIPVLALVNAEVKNLSTMISGCNSDLLSIEKYQSVGEMREIILKHIEKVKFTK